MIYVLRIFENTNNKNNSAIWRGGENRDEIILLWQSAVLKVRQKVSPTFECIVASLITKF